jgi:5-formyltetrahydrofolate cyclo-ligase
VAQKTKIKELLAPYRAFITYVPLRTEVPFLDYVELTVGSTVFEIAPRVSLDPLEEATRAIAAIAAAPAAIFIPGRSFDGSGTRHGQGGGWYDRFLATIPREWLRIGFCYDKQFSETPLLRQPWDQEMDVVCVISNGNVRIFDARV